MTVTYAGQAPLPLPEGPAKAKRDTTRAMWLGARGCCPACGKGRIFGRYLKVNPTCAACGEELHHHRADDAPPYFTIFIVGHVVLPMALALEVALMPALWVHMALWGPLIVALSLLLLPPVKGALIGLQWANYMHGFDPNALGDDQPGVDFGPDPRRQ